MSDDEIYDPSKILDFPVGDFPERLDRAYAAAMAALEDESPTTMLEEHPYVVLKREYDELLAESRAASRKARRFVRFDEVSRGQWRDIKSAHPPRTDGDDETVKADRFLGFNVVTAEDDLVFAAIVEPVFESRADFDEWADKLGAGKWEAVAKKALEVTLGARANPKSLPDSPTPKSGLN